MEGKMLRELVFHYTYRRRFALQKIRSERPKYKYACDIQKKNLTARVAHLLKNFPTLESANSANIAARLKISERTLFRQLGKENIKFQDLLIAERRRRIHEEKIYRCLSTEDLALHLGYSDPKSFYRAFRDWMSAGYSEYKKKN